MQSASTTLRPAILLRDLTALKFSTHFRILTCENLIPTYARVTTDHLQHQSTSTTSFLDRDGAPVLILIHHFLVYCSPESFSRSWRSPDRRPCQCCVLHRLTRQTTFAFDRLERLRRNSPTSRESQPVSACWDFDRRAPRACYAKCFMIATHFI